MMSGRSPETVAAHVKIYARVFLALAALTVATVGASYLSAPVAAGIAIALAIAAFKASLVAAFFMHLSAEKKIIFAILALTVFFLMFLLLLPSIDRF